MSASMHAVSRTMNHPAAALATPAALDLHTFTDPVAMRALLQQQLPGFAEGWLRIDALRVCKVRRNLITQTNQFLVALQFLAAWNGWLVAQLLAAKLAIAIAGQC